MQRWTRRMEYERSIDLPGLTPPFTPEPGVKARRYSDMRNSGKPAMRSVIDNCLKLVRQHVNSLITQPKRAWTLWYRNCHLRKTSGSSAARQQQSNA